MSGKQLGERGEVMEGSSCSYQDLNFDAKEMGADSSRRGT